MSAVKSLVTFLQKLLLENRVPFDDFDDLDLKKVLSILWVTQKNELRKAVVDM